MAPKYLTVTLTNTSRFFEFYDDLIFHSSYLRSIIREGKDNVVLPYDNKVFADVEHILRSGGMMNRNVGDYMKVFACLLFLEVNPTVIHHAFNGRYENDFFELIYQSNPSDYMFRVIERFDLLDEVPYCKNCEKYLPLMSRAKAVYTIRKYVQMSCCEALYCDNYIEVSKRLMENASSYIKPDELNELRVLHSKLLEYVA